MAQTKRKRQTKHRGNAAGSVTSKGRTSRPPSEKERKARSRDQVRQQRLNRRPTWKSTIQRAALAAVMILVLLLLTQRGRNILLTVALALAAFLFYLPTGYYSELWLWRRRMKKQGKPVT